MSGDRGNEIDLSLVNSVRDKNGRNVQRQSKKDNEDNYGYVNRGRKKSSKNGKGKPYSRSKRKKKKGIKVFIAVVSFLVIAAAIMAAAIMYVPGAKKFVLSKCGGTFLKCFVSEDEYGNIYDKDFDKDNVAINPGVDKEKFTGFYTLALFGIDSRDESMDAGVNADSIIIASINQDTGEVVMSSIYRDTWLNIPSGKDEDVYRKINSAYCSGGVKGAIDTINTNFDLNISDYVTINFKGLATIIDMLGGLDMTISESEAFYINDYLSETRVVTGMDAPDVKVSGQVHLNGLQVTAFCRIRYCEFIDQNGNRFVDDMGRTARQRYVLSLMIDKAKSAGVSKVMDIAESVFSGKEEIVRTSIAYDDMMDMIPTFIGFELGETKGFPFTYDYPDESRTNGESAVGVAGLEYNVSKLHKFLYGEENYIPTAKVREIAKRLEKMTGVGEIRLKEDRIENQE